MPMRKLVLLSPPPEPSADQATELLGITRALHADTRRCAIDLAQVMDAQLEGGRADILLQPLEFRRARNRHAPWIAGKQPRERELRRRRVVACRDRGEQIDQRPVRLARLRGRLRRIPESPLSPCSDAMVHPDLQHLRVNVQRCTQAR